MNRMDMNIVTSQFTAQSFNNSKYDFKDEKTGQEGRIEIQKPMEVLFEGVDTNEYFETTDKDTELESVFEKIETDWNYLFTGHWLSGNIGEDRKDIGMMIKIFCETFKNKKKQPGLILKTSSATFSVLDREDMIGRIQRIKDTITGDLPKIYLLHGELTDSQMNNLYNQDKVKAHVSFTHGEGFGRPLLEAAQSGKPIIASAWSGHLDFLHKNHTILVGGSLTDVPKGSFPDEMTVEQAKWFTVNYQQASNAFVEVYKNYNKYLIKAKQLQIHTKNSFSFEAMKSKLETIVDGILQDVPQAMELKLPKLKKAGNSEPTKVKLPKLTKV